MDDALAIDGHAGAQVNVGRLGSVHIFSTVRTRRGFTLAESGARQTRHHFSVNHPKLWCVVEGMTVRRSGVGTETDVMWVPALARGLIREDVLRSMRYRDGYTDLLGSGAPARRSLAQRAMNSPSVAAIYQHIWRPIMVAVMDLH